MTDNIVVDGNLCKLLTTAQVEGNEYLYLAKLEDDDISGDFFVYKKESNGDLTKITNSLELKKILLVVTSNLMEEE